MSTYRGIAATTWALQHLAGSAARLVVPEASVTVDLPGQQTAPRPGESRLNVSLLQVVPNPALSTMEPPGRSAPGRAGPVPQVALNLSYLLSYFGPATKAQLMLAAVELAMRQQPVLDPTFIALALADQPDLQDPGSEHQSAPVQLTPVAVTLTELTQLWASLFQLPYVLSTLYQASGVIIDAPTPPSP